jgi:hypothetical protein
MLADLTAPKTGAAVKG